MRVPPSSGVNDTSTAVDWGGTEKASRSHPQVKVSLCGKSTSTKRPSIVAVWIFIRQAPPGRGSSVASLPIQETSFAGSVKYSNTTSGGAATWTSCSTVSVSTRSVGTFPPLVGLDHLLQPLEPLREDVGEELVQVAQPLGPHAV